MQVELEVSEAFEVKSSRSALNIGAHLGPRDEDFWARFEPDVPVIVGKAVLEIGCGEGARCCEVAALGARRVVGVDPFASSITVARQRLSSLPEDGRERVLFFEGTLDRLPAERFDLVISENTIEHVLDVSGLLREVVDRLNPGGKVYFGFGPLYYAYDGDHGWMRAMLPGRKYFPWPWGHVIFESYIFRKLSRIHGKEVKDTRTWPYLTLNQLTLPEYLRTFRESKLHLTHLRVNYARSTKAKMLFAIGRVPGLGRYFTSNIYAVLQKPEG